MPDFAYDPAYESQTTEQFLKDVPESVWNYVSFVVFLRLIGDLDDKGLKIWDHLVSIYPVLQRIIVYTYSPLEAFDTRMGLLQLWAQADDERGDFRDPQALYDATVAWSISKLPELSIYPKIVTFLEQLRNHFPCVLQADLRKSAGHPDTLGELRKNWKAVDKQDSRTVIRIDQSPFYKIDHVIINEPEGQPRIEIHYHFLEDPMAADLEQFFTSADAYLTEWMQMFDGFEEVKNVAYSQDVMVYVYGREEKLIKPPGKHKNPFPLALGLKYDGLLKKQEVAFKGEISSEQLEWVFKDKVIKEWKGDRPPVAHLYHTLRLRAIDLLRKTTGLFAQKKVDRIHIIYRSQFPTNDDFEKAQSQSIAKAYHHRTIKKDQIGERELMIELKRMEKRQTKAVPKLIIKHLREHCFSGTPLAGLPTCEEIARQAADEYDEKEVTPRRVEQIRKELHKEIAEHLDLKIS